MSEKSFYSVKDICRILGIGRNKAYGLLNTKGFPTIRIGRTYRIDADKFDAWVSENQGKNIQTEKAEKE